MIVLFTDFGLEGPYVGQLHGALSQRAPGVPVIDLFHGVPNFDIQAAAYLLPAYAAQFPAGTIFLCVVDPGVGTARRPLMLEVDGSWYVGPDNGLFHILVRRAQACECHLIKWRPTHVSPSFHGRDLFAPVAATLAHGEQPNSESVELTEPEDTPWPDDLAKILYIDHYGNAVTGIRASQLGKETILKIGDHKVTYARVFAEAHSGQAFWYENANGLVEIAVNRERAADRLRLGLGTPIEMITGK